MSRLTVIVKRNAEYEKGTYGLSIHKEPGGSANVEPINDEEELKRRLIAFGATDAYASDILARLKKKHESVQIDFDSN